ncbi:MAG TPA: hypothetical protein VF548_01515 [Allosphingosinicella sp.]|jgi:hypothetical protein
MPLMAAYEQNDARDAARLLATMTLEGLRHDRRDPLVGNAINNMYRLLQGYRAHGFYGYVEDRRAEDETSMTSLLSSSERNVGELKHALDETFETVFGDQDPGSAIDGMKVVLRMTAYPREGEMPNSVEIARAEEFFSTLLDKLRA